MRIFPLVIPKAASGVSFVIGPIVVCIKFVDILYVLLVP